MPLKITTPPSLPGVIFGALLGLTAVHANRQTTLGWTAPNALASGIVVFRMIEDDNAEAPNNPFKWFRMTPVPLSPTSINFVDKFVLENRAYTYRLAAVDARGNFSAFADVQVTTGQWVPQTMLNLFSEDLSQAVHWVPDAGVTVSANSNPSVNGYTVNFGAADRAIAQAVPTYPLNTTGRGIYSGLFEVKGTAGETIQGFMHGDSSQSAALYQPALVTLTGGWDLVYLPRPATNVSDRYIRLGLQTYNGATARVISVRKARMMAGRPAGADATAQAAAMLASYEKTSGVGSTRQEPVWFKPSIPSYYSLMDQGYNGYHRSDENGVNPIALDNACSKTLSLSRAITVSRGAHHVETNYANNLNARTVSRNCMHIGLHPLADGVRRGQAYHGDYQRKFDVQNSYQEHTGGVYLGSLKTTGDDDKVTYLRNKVLDTDGRFATAAGGYVKTPWGEANGARPSGSTPSWAHVANFQLNGLSDSTFTSANAEIAYNEFYGRPGMSRIEDTINMSGQRAPVSSPVRVHHNLNWCNWPWDYAWFDDPNRLTRAYQLDRQGNPGEPYYDNWQTWNTYYSGSAGMPVDSSLHVADGALNGKGIEWYNNVNLGAGATMGLLDGQSVTIEQNHTAATGNLPSGYLPNPIPVVSVTGRRAGYQATIYYQVLMTVSAAVPIGSTSIPVTYRSGNGTALVSGGKIGRQNNGDSVSTNQQIGVLAGAQAAGSSTLTLAQVTTFALNQGDPIGYFDLYMSGNKMRRNIVESTQTDMTSSMPDVIAILENYWRGVPSEGREWELYGAWQTLMAQSGQVIGPTA